jgi:hypothetical protein
MTTYIAYLDESGTHQGAAVSVMAGFVGDERQWRKFEKRSGKLFKRYRVDIFHTIDVRRGDADFENWTVDRKLEFLDELQHIVRGGPQKRAGHGVNLRMGTEQTESAQSRAIRVGFCRQEKLPSDRGGRPSCLQRMGSRSWTKANRNT